MDNDLTSATRTVLLASISLLMGGLGIYYWQIYTYWSRRNVKCPIPIPPFGNLLPTLIKPRQSMEAAWLKKYGRVYGQYQGVRPVLIIGDPNVLRQVTIKDFNIFTDRLGVPVRNWYQERALFFQRGDHWRGMRNIISPTFSTGRMKSMHHVFDECSKKLVDYISNDLERVNPLDTHILFTRFTITSALNAFYGINIDHNEDGRTDADNKHLEIFTSRAAGFFRSSPLRLFFSFLIPEPILKAIGLSSISLELFDFFYKQSKTIVDRRRKDPNKRMYNDYLDILLKSEQEEETKEEKQIEDHHVIDQGKLEKTEKSNMKLTEDEVYCQVMVIMLVATGTTTDLLVNTCYALAHHQDVQRKLRDEILTIAEKKPDGSLNFPYEALGSAKYLDCVLSESMRCLPVVLEMDRVASTDYHIGEPYNISIERGTIVKLPYGILSVDPEFWDEPTKFDPERFNDQNKPKIVPGSYNPFGLGPRFCIGFRFAMAEARVCLAYLLHSYDILPRPGSIFPPKPKKFAVTITSYENTDVIFKKRNLL